MRLKELGVSVFEPNYLWLEKWTEEEWSKLSNDIKKFVVMGLTYDHFQKIKMADSVFIFNKDGYIGNSVNMEIGYAVALAKPIYCLQSDDNELGRVGFFRKIIATPEELAKALGYLPNTANPSRKKITICGSISATYKMKEVADVLLKEGYDVELPYTTKKILKGETTLESYLEAKQKDGDFDARNKAENDLIKQYYNIIKAADAILVVNIDKNNIKNYIGGNTLLEMGFAHVLNKKIFLLNDIPDISYRDEIRAIQPIILNNDLSKISF